MALSSPPERSRKSWNLLSATPPLVGFAPSQCALPPIRPLRVHSQEPKPPSVRRSHPPDPVPPSWFRTTMTAYSTQRSRVCCTPQPAKGSPRFMRPEPSATRRRHRYSLALPATRFTPSEDFPSPAAVPHHCGRCPLAVTDHRLTPHLAEARCDACPPDRGRGGATVPAALRRAHTVRRRARPDVRSPRGTGDRPRCGGGEQRKRGAGQIQ
jgi:hypothetical protein